VNIENTNNKSEPANYFVSLRKVYAINLSLENHEKTPMRYLKIKSAIIPIKKKTGCYRVKYITTPKLTVVQNQLHILIKRKLCYSDAQSHTTKE